MPERHIVFARESGIGPPGGVAEAYFASKLPYLPDYWDLSLTDGEQEARVTRVLARHREFVQSLAQLGHGSTFELSLVSCPPAPVQVLYLVAVDDAAHAEDVWRYFHAVFPSELDLRLEPIPRAAVHGLRNPFGNLPLHRYQWVPEANQPMTPPLLGAVEPMLPRTDNGLQALRALLGARVPCVLSYSIRPLEPSDPDLTLASRGWQRWLQYLEILAGTGTSPGELDMLRQHFEDPLTSAARTALLNGLGDSSLVELTQKLQSAQIREHYLVPRHALNRSLRTARRLLEATTHFQWAVSACAPDSLPEEIRLSVAADLARDPNQRITSRYRCIPVDEQGLSLDPEIAWPPDMFELAQSEFRVARGELVDDLAASALISIPLLPRGGLPGVLSHPANPFSTWQSFDRPHSEDDSRPILLGHYVDSRAALRTPLGGGFEVTADDLTRHALVTGSTGAGKSTTCRRLLAELRRLDLPFLVIEPVKSEYADLWFSKEFIQAGTTPLPTVHALGDPMESLWLNPFFVRPGVSVAAHISYLQSCFMAAFPMPSVFGMVFLRILREAYRQKIKQVREQSGVTPYALSTPVSRSHRDADFPDLNQLLRCARSVMDALNYSGEFASNLRAGIQFRIESLAEGVIGEVLRPRQWPSFESTLARQLSASRIVELRLIPDKSEKALLTAFMLTSLYEYLEQRPTTDKLHHLTLVEEAHVLLENVPRSQSADTADTRGKALELFSDMLAEVRSRGEGLVIAEQLPSKLLPDAVKNTNLKIMHRMTARDDREMLGGAININATQSRFASTLPRGRAIVFREGFSEPALIDVNPIQLDGAERHALQRFVAAKLAAGEPGRIRLPSDDAVMRSMVLLGTRNRTADDIDALCQAANAFLLRAFGQPVTPCGTVWYLARLLGLARQCLPEFDDRWWPEVERWLTQRL